MGGRRRGPPRRDGLGDAAAAAESAEDTGADWDLSAYVDVGEADGELRGRVEGDVVGDVAEVALVADAVAAAKAGSAVTGDVKAKPMRGANCL